ncbi:MAG: aldehyde dehydrogenase family protein [Polyangiaceae bacterium]|nr:aldehyde dehydrogenase family protein [Polyangiaceae bacterium]
MQHLAVGTPVLVGTELLPLPAMNPGDRLLAVARTGSLLVVSRAALAAATEAVSEAEAAFQSLARAPSERVDGFFEQFADRLADNGIWREVVAANRADVERALARGRAVGRLRVSDKMRAGMIDGLRRWARSPSRIGEVVERRQGDGWVVERRRAPLGVVAFVFEGRPNVMSDGVGVVKNGNTCVMRIGGDALDTALVIEDKALRPALAAAGLPEATVRLLRSRDHDAGQALFTLGSVRLAVARGSGPTVALLGSIAEAHGIPVSLHGTGGAWMYIDETATAAQVRNAIVHSLDRKVCNTLNVLILDRAALDGLAGAVAEAFAGRKARVHACRGSEGIVPTASVIDEQDLAREWEWDDVPDCSLVVADGRDRAVDLINRYSPHFVASILSGRSDAFEDFYRRVDAPYVGNAFTRWVDGQWAWDRPELGLTNWERGRLLGRSGFLSGDDIFTVRDVFIDRTGEASQAR